MPGSKTWIWRKIREFGLQQSVSRKRDSGKSDSGTTRRNDKSTGKMFHPNINWLQ